MDLWAAVDRGTRQYWKTFGRRVDLGGKHSWLRAPVIGDGGGAVEDNWLRAEAERIGGRIEDDPEAGLLADIQVLGGDGFDPARLHPDVRDFYERTGLWRMEAWVQWAPVFALGGWFVTRFFGRRVGQLALPIRSLDTARGIDSRVERVVGGRWVSRRGVVADFPGHGRVPLQRVLSSVAAARARAAERACVVSAAVGECAGLSAAGGRGGWGVASGVAAGCVRGRRCLHHGGRG